ncbi:hypothetical protein TSUD_369010 [Trifolium subterraneum]|uniref:Uncharacterized protein n=1 Tax=Trifolium subterraneum TaxID=3900 RepID=A0A2Z6PGT9_TRISU|nr:hypothetical protein TSUD_369010 [Trifolium subterraneum]
MTDDETVNDVDEIVAIELHKEDEDFGIVTCNFMGLMDTMNLEHYQKINLSMLALRKRQVVKGGGNDRMLS